MLFMSYLLVTDFLLLEIWNPLLQLPTVSEMISSVKRWLLQAHSAELVLEWEDGSVLLAEDRVALATSCRRCSSFSSKPFHTIKSLTCHLYCTSNYLRFLPLFGTAIVFNQSFFKPGVLDSKSLSSFKTILLELSRKYWLWQVSLEVASQGLALLY